MILHTYLRVNVAGFPWHICFDNKIAEYETHSIPDEIISSDTFIGLVVKTTDYSNSRTPNVQSVYK